MYNRLLCCFDRLVRVRSSAPERASSSFFFRLCKLVTIAVMCSGDGVVAVF